MSLTESEIVAHLSAAEIADMRNVTRRKGMLPHEDALRLLAEYEHVRDALAAQQAVVAAAQKALEDIRDGSGAVCAVFETCTHQMCDDSAYAHMRAIEALHALDALPAADAAPTLRRGSRERATLHRERVASR